MSELEQTIEELEAEVLAELEEASDAQTKGATPAEGKKKIDAVTPGGEVEDGGSAVVDPEAKTSPTDVAAKKAKAIGGDAQQKGAGKSDGPQKLAAGHTPEGEVVAEAKKMTKTEALEQIAKMKKSEIDEMLAQHASSLAEAGAAKTEEELKTLEDAKSEIEEKIKSISVKEDVAALVDGEGLSEEFKTKAATIFEAAVKSKTREEITRIHESMTSDFEVKLEESVEALTEKVDTYLNYVVEEWTKENELAIERGLKGEIAEDFISGLKQLFEDHYIDVPDEKYDVLGEMNDAISSLEEKLNEQVAKNVELSNQVNNSIRSSIVTEAANGLSDVETEKFSSLVEELAFDNIESFTTKVKTLRESYFNNTTATDIDSIVNDSPVDNLNEETKKKVVDPRMAQYLSAWKN